MDWLESTAEGDSVQAADAFAVLRDVPAQLTSRVRAITDADSHQATEAQEADLAAFPPLFKGETWEQRLGRLAAYERAWAWLACQFKEVTDAANSDTFRQLAAFAFEQHPDAEEAARQRAIPTAVCVAGSINPADHADTFPSLVQELRQQGCYAALLGQRELPGGTSVAPALRGLLRQLSGLETEADDMLAATAWYADELSRDATHDATRAADDSSAVLSPLGKLALRTPAKAAAGPGRAAGLSARGKGEALASPFDRLALQTPQQGAQQQPRRSQRNAEAQPRQAGEGAEAAAGDTGQGLTAARRPLVAVIEGVEGVDPATLRDLLTVLSEARARLPVTLVLGMATTAAALGHILPGGACDALTPRPFRLPGSLQLLEAFFRSALAAPECPLLFGHALVAALGGRFMEHDFTLRGFRQGLQVACMAWAQQCPTASLAGLPPQEQAAACALLPRAVRPPAGALAEAQQAADAWRLALLAVNAAALACGRRAASDGLSVRELCGDAAAPGFGASERGQALLRSLQAGLAALPHPEAEALARRLLQLAAGRPAGTALAAAVRAAQAEPDAAAALGQQQQPAAEASAAPPPAAAEGAAQQPQRGGHSLARRRLALAQAVRDSRPAAAAAEAPAAGPSLGARLRPVLQAAFEALDRPPQELAGAAAFTASDEGRARRRLSYAPRAALEAALTQPEGFLGGPPLGLCAQQQETAVAYQLLLECGEDVDVADWFAGFCTVCQGGSAAEAAAAAAAAAAAPAPEEPSPRKKARRRGRRGREDLQPQQQEPPQAASLRQTTLPFKGRRPGGGGEGQPALTQLVSRFTQATNELQLLGAVKPAARKGAGGRAKRLVWPAPASLDA